MHAVHTKTNILSKRQVWLDGIEVAIKLEGIHIGSGDRFTKVRIQSESPWQSDDIRRGGLQVKYVPAVSEELCGVVDIRIIREESIETWDFTVLAHILAYNDIWGWLLTNVNDRWFINQLSKAVQKFFMSCKQHELRLHRNSLCHTCPAECA